VAVNRIWQHLFGKESWKRSTIRVSGAPPTTRSCLNGWRRISPSRSPAETAHQAAHDIERLSERSASRGKGTRPGCALAGPAADPEPSTRATGCCGHALRRLESELVRDSLLTWPESDRTLYGRRAIENRADGIGSPRAGRPAAGGESNAANDKPRALARPAPATNRRRSIYVLARRNYHLRCSMCSTSRMPPIAARSPSASCCNRCDV